MPSVDRVGRYFPLTLAAVFPAGHGLPPSDIAGPWLEACEAAGRAALDDDIPPDELARRLPLLSAAGVAGPAGDPRGDTGSGAWWTDGGPRVPEGRLVLATLPDATQFAMMLDAGLAGGLGVEPDSRLETGLGLGLGSGLGVDAPTQEEA
jgi:type VI secretion system protein ImpM